MFDHCGARTRGRNDRIGVSFFKYLYKSLREFTGFMAVSGVECWLTATGLSRVENDLAANPA
jgi:hypothetical protein